MTSLKLFIRFFDAVIIYMITVSVFWFYYFTLDTLGGEDSSDSFLNYFYIICAITASIILYVIFAVKVGRIVKSSLLLVSLMLIVYSIELVTQGAGCRFYQYTGWTSILVYSSSLSLSLALMIKLFIKSREIFYVSLIPLILVLFDFYQFAISFSIISYLFSLINLR